MQWLWAPRECEAAAAAEQENSRELTVERIGPQPD